MSDDNKQLTSLTLRYIFYGMYAFILEALVTNNLLILFFINGLRLMKFCNSLHLEYCGQCGQNDNFSQYKIFPVLPLPECKLPCHNVQLLLLVKDSAGALQQGITGGIRVRMVLGMRKGQNQH